MGDHHALRCRDTGVMFPLSSATGGYGSGLGIWETVISTRLLGIFVFVDVRPLGLTVQAEPQHHVRGLLPFLQPRLSSRLTLNICLLSFRVSLDPEGKRSVLLSPSIPDGGLDAALALVGGWHTGPAFRQSSAAALLPGYPSVLVLCRLREDEGLLRQDASGKGELPVTCPAPHRQ